MFCFVFASLNRNSSLQTCVPSGVLECLFQWLLRVLKDLAHLGSRGNGRSNIYHWGNVLKELKVMGVGGIYEWKNDTVDWKKRVQNGS